MFRVALRALEADGLARSIVTTQDRGFLVFFQPGLVRLDLSDMDKRTIK